MQTAGGLIRALRELSAEFQNGHHALKGGASQIGVNVDGNSASVVFNGDGTVGIDHNGDRGREPRESLVERIVDNLVDKVMESHRGDVADIHGRTGANVFKVAQMLHILGGIGGICARNRSVGYVLRVI